MNRLNKILIAAVSGGLLALAFPRFELSLLAWFAFVPLLWVIQDLSPKRAFFYGWISGMGFYLGTVYWVVHTIGLYSNIPTPAAVIPLLLMSAVLASYTGAFSAGLRWSRARGSTALVVGVSLWVTLEWVRGFFFVGFPWASLGYSQHPWLDLIQVAEFTGVYGVSALVMLGNLAIFGTLSTRGSGRWLVLDSAVALVAGISVWGGWRRIQLAELPPAYHLRIALVQGNVPQDRKWDPAFQASTIAAYEELSRQAAARGVDLIAWPEAAVPFFFQAEGKNRDRLLQLVNELRTPLLFGSPAFAVSEGDFILYNRAYLLAPNGELIGSYDKMRLTPFGEYIPLQGLFFFVEKLVEGIGDFAAGTDTTVFTLPGAGSEKFGVLICYEGIFPELARRFVARGAEFLVNITNDAWFGDTSAPYQHLYMQAMRAVENRVPMARAANTGFSAFIDIDGRVRTRTALYQSAVLVEDMAWPEVSSFYSRYGDVFVRLCTFGTLSVLGYTSIKRRRSRHGGSHAR